LEEPRAKTHLICDTNVFRYLGNGRLSEADILKPEETVCYTAIAAVELGSHIEKDFQAKKRACMAIRDLSARQLPDPDSFVAGALDLELAEASEDWSDVIEIIAKADSEEELTETGIRYPDGSRRWLDARYADRFRRNAEGPYIDALLRLASDEIPDLASWRAQRTGHPPKLKGDQKTRFLQLVGSREWWVTAVSIEWERVRSVAKAAPLRPPTDAASLVVFLCPCAIYTQYLRDVLVAGRQVESNDFGDLRLFDYSVSDNHIIVTAEKKWSRIAKAAGFSERVRIVTPA